MTNHQRRTNNKGNGRWLANVSQIGVVLAVSAAVLVVLTACSNAVAASSRMDWAMAPGGGGVLRLASVTGAELPEGSESDPSGDEGDDSNDGAESAETPSTGSSVQGESDAAGDSQGTTPGENADDTASESEGTAASDATPGESGAPAEGQPVADGQDEDADASEGQDADEASDAKDASESSDDAVGGSEEAPDQQESDADAPNQQEEDEQDAEDDAPETSDEDQGEQADEVEGEKGDADEQASDEPEAEVAAQAQETTLAGVVKSADDTTYVVRATFGADAGIPQDAELSVREVNQIPTDYSDEDKRATTYKDRPLPTETFVSAEQMERRTNSMTRALSITSKDLLLWSKVLDIRVVSAGEEIEPKSKVKVEIETTAVPANVSDALEAAILDDDASEKLVCTNTTGTKEGEDRKTPEELAARVEMVVPRMGEVALAQVADRKLIFEDMGRHVEVFGARRANLEPVAVPLNLNYLDGKLLVAMYAFAEDLDCSHSSVLWLQAMDAEVTDQYGGLMGYVVAGNGDATLAFGTKGASGVVPIDADAILALVWDSGYRLSAVRDGDVTVVGQMPQGTTANADDVTGDYQDASALVGAPQQDEELETLAAVDLSMADGDGNDYVPDEEHPVAVTLAGAAQGQDDFTSYNVVRVEDDGATTPVAFSVGDTGLTFAADTTGTYAVVRRTVVSRTLTASDGREYRITVSYDAESGIPEDAELQVTELTEQAAEYDAYVQRTAEALGTKPDHLAFARAFDITLANPQTGERYQPTKPVDVSIQLLSESVLEGDDVDVVHFPGTDASTPAPSDATTAEVIDASVTGEAIEFQSDSFSIYIVSQEELLQHFVFLNGTDPSKDVFSEQVLIEGESLVESPKASKTGQVFQHWSSTPTGDNTFVDDPDVEDDDVVGLSYQPVAIDEADIRTKTAAELGIADASTVTRKQMQDYMDAHPVYFYAVYDAPVVVVTFYNQSGLVVQKVKVNKPGTLDTTDDQYDYVPIQDKENTFIKFLYWTEEKRATTTSDDAGTLSFAADDARTELELFPVLEEGHYLYFDSNKAALDGESATYIPPLFVTNEDRTGTKEENALDLVSDIVDALNERKDKDPIIPKAEGYTFKGWYVTAAGEASDLPILKPSDDGTELVYDSTTADLFMTMGVDNTGQFPNNPTLFARWEKVSTAKYTVVVWRQKLSDDGKQVLNEYSYAESHVEDPVSTSENLSHAKDKYKQFANDEQYNDAHGLTGANRITGKDNPYYGFEFYDWDTDVAISPAGSTVVNVYYRRIVRSLEFRVIKSGTYSAATNNNNPQYGLINGHYVQLTRHDVVTRHYLYRYYGTEYNGTIYDTSHSIVTNPAYPNTYYYKYKTNYYELSWGDVIGYEWFYNDEEYTGQRYTYSAGGSHYETVKTITKAFGVSIIDQFPIHGDDGKVYNGTSWRPHDSIDYTIELMSLQSMPNESFYFTYNREGNFTDYIYYCIEPSGAADEEVYATTTRVSNGKTYMVQKVQDHGYGSAYLEFVVDMTAIPGYDKKPENSYHKNTGRSFQLQTSGTYVGKYVITNPTGITYFYYDRNSYSVKYYDVFNGQSNEIVPVGSDAANDAAARTVKYKQIINESISLFNDYPSNEDESDAHYGYSCMYDDGAGHERPRWYIDETLTTRAFTYEPTQTEIDSTKDENDIPHYVVLDRMPAQDVLQLYLGWEPIKYPVYIIPDGGELGGKTLSPNNYRTTFNVAHGEKITEYKDISRDYVYVGTGEGTHDYVVTFDDTKSALYRDDLKESDNPKKDYLLSPGAYVLLGWYEATEFEKDDNGNDIPSQPKKDRYGQYKTASKPFDFGSPPNRSVTLVAKWQRAGGFYLRYNIVDPDLHGVSYAGIQIPTDEDEYIENSKALVKSSLGAPRGYALDYWTDRLGNRYEPNDLITISEALGPPSGKTMIIELVAHYKPYVPNERVMADYTFKTNVIEDPDQPGHYMWNTDHDSEGDPVFNTYEVQRIAVNEELKAPITPPAPDGYAFLGWYYDRQGTRLFDGFGVVSHPVYTTLYAVFEKVHTVNYYMTDAQTGERTETILATQTYSAEGTPEYLDTRHVIHPVDTDHYVHAWTTDGTDNYDYTRVTRHQVTDDMTLYAIINTREYVKFDPQGGSFVDQQEIPDGGWPARPAAPTRNGYDFLGWYTEPNGGTEYQFNKKLSEVDDFNGTTLYAHWRANGSAKGELTIIWWAETAEGGKYEYQKSETLKKTGDQDNRVTVGTHLTATFLASHSGYDDVSNLEVVPSANRQFFELSSAQSDESFTVDDTGGILNLRFIRKRYTLRFDPNTYATIKAGPFDDDGNPATYNNTTMYEIKNVWLDKEIANDWPIIREEGYPTVVPNSGTTSVGWESGPNIIYAVQVLATRSILRQADENGVVLFNALQKTKESTTVMRYYLEGSESRSLRHKLTGYTYDSTNLKTYIGNNKQYTSTFLPRDITGYSLITVDDNPLVTYINNGYSVKKSTLGFSTENGDDYTGQYATGSGTETYTKDLYTYSFKPEYSNGKYWYHQSAILGLIDAFYPITIALPEGGKVLDNTTHQVLSAGQTDVKDGYTVYYTDNNGVTHTLDPSAIRSNSICITTDGNEPYEHIVGKNTQYVTWDKMVYDSIEETTTKSDNFERPVDDGTNYVSFFYKKKSYKVRLFLVDENGVSHEYKYKVKDENDNEVEKTGEVMVPYQDYVPAALIAAGIPDPEATEEGKTFAMWSASPSSDEVFDHNMPAYNVDLYARWKSTEYTVTTKGVGVNGDANDETVDTQYNQVPYGTQLKALGLPTPTKSNEVFAGWQAEDASGEMKDVSLNQLVKSNMDLYPKWEDLMVRQVEYYANFPTGVTGHGTAPTDGSRYKVGTKVVIKSGAGERLMDGSDPAEYEVDPLYVDRTDVNGHPYEGTFAYWNTKPDGTGQSYYPGNTYVFYADAEDDDGNPIMTLKLYAIYSQYRETTLTYDINVPDVPEGKPANFFAGTYVLQEDEEALYKNKLRDADGNAVYDADGNKIQGTGDGKTVQVLFRDVMNPDWESSFKKKPNDEFPIGEDEDFDLNEAKIEAGTIEAPNPSAFTVKLQDTDGNSYVFGGWATERGAHIKAFANGDKAYVNTIDEATSNTLYAIWGVCKVVDKNNEEYIFTSIEAAVEWIHGHHSILPAAAAGATGDVTGTIEMLTDIKMAEPVRIDYDTENIVLTTASTLAADKAANGGKAKWQFHYDGGTDGKQTVATITRGYSSYNGRVAHEGSKPRLFWTDGDFTLKNITIDGNSAGGYQSDNIGGLIKSTHKLTILKGTTLRNSTTSSYAGAISSEGDMTIEGESNASDILIDNCKSNGEGCGAVYATAENLTIKYCTVKNCSAVKGDGGAIRHVPNNNADQHFNEGRTVVEHCAFENNTASAAGGSIHTEAVSIRVADSVFTDCEATAKQGAAVEHFNTNAESTAEFEGCTMLRCNAPGNRGGAVCTEAQKTLSVKGCTFIDCYAKQGGGAIAIDMYTSNASGCAATISGCTFAGCRSDSESGGAVGSYAKSLLIQKNGSTSTSFTSCYAATNGGALYVDKASNGVQLNDVVIDGNGTYEYVDGLVTKTVKLPSNKKNAQLGGAIYANSGTTTITNGRIEHCSASNTDDGGAVNLKDGAKLQLAGSAYIYDNPSSSGQQKNVVLSKDDNTVIKVSGALTTTAKVGVYDVTKTTNHHAAGEDFASYKDNSCKVNLNAFVNDHDTRLYGIVDPDQTSKKYICWVYGQITVNKVWEVEGTAPSQVTVAITNTGGSAPNSDTLTLSTSASTKRLYPFGTYKVTETKVGDTAIANTSYTVSYSPDSNVTLAPTATAPATPTITITNTTTMVPVVVQKVWDADAPQYQLDEVQYVSFKVKGVSGSTKTDLTARAQSTPSSSAVSSLTPNDATSAGSRTWERLVYVPKYSSGTTAFSCYVIEEEGLAGVTNKGIWKCTPSSFVYDVAANKEERTTAYWEDVTGNTREVYLQLRAQDNNQSDSGNNGLGRYQDVYKMDLYFTTTKNDSSYRGTLYYTSVDFGNQKYDLRKSALAESQGAGNEYIYVKVLLPADVDYHSISLLQTSDTNYINKYLHNNVQGLGAGLCNWAYGIITYNHYSFDKNRPTGGPSFTWQAEASGSKFDMVDFVATPPSGNYLTIDGTSFVRTLKVFTVNQLTLTNEFDPIARVRSGNGEWRYFSELTTKTVTQNGATNTLNGAFNYANTLSGNVTIETLKASDDRYTQAESFTFAAGKNITLTTTQDAAWNAAGDGHFTTTISRGFANGSMLAINGGATLTLTNITLDGNKGTYTGTDDGGIVSVTGATLNVTTGATLQNSKTVDRGGAVNVNGGTLHIDSNAKFLNDESAHGGAIHIGNDSVITTIEGAAEFVGCKATGWGGGIFTRSANTTIRGTVSIRDCEADSDHSGGGDGGGINVGWGGSVSISGSVSIRNCSANYGGGLNVESRMNGYGACTASVSGVSITGCSATSKGAGVYANSDATLNMSGGSVSGNTVSATCGAVEAADASTRLNFSGSAYVYGNTYGSQQKNVVLDTDTNDIIRATGDLGSDARIGVYVTDGANKFDKHGKFEQDFGTYSVNTDGNRNLNCFTNDRNGLYGVVCTHSADKSQHYIMWQSYLCKLTDDERGLLYTRTKTGEDAEGHDVYLYKAAVYDTLTEAFNAAKGVGPDGTGTVTLYKVRATAQNTTPVVSEYTYTAGGNNQAIHVEMLKNYVMPESDRVTNDVERDLTLTTSALVDTAAGTLPGGIGDSFEYVYSPGEHSDWPEGDPRWETATITRGFDGGADANKSMFYVNNTSNPASTTQATMDIILDGKEGNTQHTGRAIYGNSGSLRIGSGTIVQRFQTPGNGGAVYSTKGITVSGTSENNAQFWDCNATSGNGGAIFTAGNTADTQINISNCVFEDCFVNNTDGKGGAMYFNNGTQTLTDVTIDGVADDHKDSNGIDAYQGGGIYLNAGSLTLTHVVLHDCHVSGTSSTVDNSNGGGIYMNGGTLTVNGNSNGMGEFKECAAPNGNGGAVYNASSESNATTHATVSITNTAIDGHFMHPDNPTPENEEPADTTVPSGEDDANDPTVDDNPDDDDPLPGHAIIATQTHLEDDVPNAKNGGAIYMASGTLSLGESGTTNAVSIKNCTATLNGGAIYNASSASSTATGATVKLNNVTIDGHDQSRSGGAFPAAYMSASNGGAVFLGNGTLYIDRGEISNCRVHTNGGVIYNNSALTATYGTGTDAYSATVRIDGTTFKGFSGTDGTLPNAENGGAIFNNNGKLRMNGGQLLDFKVTECGGAIYEYNVGVTNIDTINLQSVRIDGHAGGLNDDQANAQLGGAIYTHAQGNTTNGGSIRLSGCQLVDCVASSQGGAIFNRSTRRDANPADITKDEPTVHLLNTAIDGHDSLTAGTPNAVRGGAILLANGTMVIEGTSVIEDCISSESGGAIDSYGSGTQFKGKGATYEKSASDYTVKLINTKIQDCSVDSSHGGAIYVKAILTMTNSEITRCSAGDQGGAVYVRDDNASRLNMSGGTISGNSSINGGAVDVQTKNVRLNFSGNAVVYGNPNNNSGTQQKNVVLRHDSNAIINAIGTGLGENAHIGVYVVDGDDTYDKHGQYEQDFGTWATGAGSNLDRFTNDRNGMYGMECDLTGGAHGQNGHANIIRWQSYLCKLTDADGNLLYTDSEHTYPAVYNTLQEAFTALTSSTLYQGSSTTAYAGTSDIKVEMLRDYTLPKSDSLDTENGGIVNTADRKVTLKTAAKAATESDVYIYNPAAGATDDQQTYATVTRGYTGNSMFTQNSSGKTLVLTNIILDGNKDAEDSSSTSNPKATYTSTTNGGIVNIAAGTLNIGANATLQNSKTENGGAVYAVSGTTVEMAAGQINGNVATVAGAGVYLAEGATMNLSGAPNFGGSGVKADSTLDTTKGNFLDGTQTDKTNGGAAYTKARQDIYVAGYIGTVGGDGEDKDDPKKATSLYVTGKLTNANGANDGTIWVWAEVPETADENNHYEQLKQFAKFDLPEGTTLTEDEKLASMRVFRNAVDDGLTGASETLYGQFSDDDTSDPKVYIYWSGVSGYREVILRKVDATDKASLAGATFNLYKGNSSTIYTWKDRNDKTKTLVMGKQGDKQNLTSKDSGVIWVGELPYGTYYLKETGAPKDAEGNALTNYTGNVNKWFCLIVDDTGAYMSGGFKESTDQASKEAAKEAAEALKAATS